MSFLNKPTEYVEPVPEVVIDPATGLPSSFGNVQISEDLCSAGYRPPRLQAPTPRLLPRSKSEGQVTRASARGSRHRAPVAEEPPIPRNTRGVLWRVLPEKKDGTHLKIPRIKGKWQSKKVLALEDDAEPTYFEFCKRFPFEKFHKDELGNYGEGLWSKEWHPPGKQQMDYPNILAPRTTLKPIGRTLDWLQPNP
eukprot:gnl/TRDRNA2_/TRDRNA2_93958_c0_seq1.p1 gnl/TRDRNA2_/TRDRNA2_93958_c0~~gnl/TRDRNA2_/TRDRNA2_93958_c0_seq1.p1  ORF type:complete len:210 (-),score=25.73 gnl/TRDRNA2_/TRDRNA2_93958_c0_seq1:133-717(-)